MEFLQSILLSLLQGVTEFLPVSSSGHLALAEALLANGEGGHDAVAFAVLVHAATLAAIVIVFRADVLSLLKYFLGEGWRTSRLRGMRWAWLIDARGRMIVAVVLASIPTALIGFFAKDFLESLYDQPKAVGGALCITALLLGLTYRTSRRGRDKSEGDVATPFPMWMALAVGVVQGLAIVPGISRSGSTIAVALLLGMHREAAGKFSFLIAIPAIMGALLLQLSEFDAAAIAPATGAVAFVVAGASGWISLKLLMRFLRGGRLYYFAFYCLALGISAIIWF